MQNKAINGSERSPATKEQDHLHTEHKIKTIRGSERGPAAKKQDHLLSKCKTRPSEGQRGVLQQRNKITYILSAKQGHQRVREGSCTTGTRSLTSWTQNMAI